MVTKPLRDGGCFTQRGGGALLLSTQFCRLFYKTTKNEAVMEYEQSVMVQCPYCGQSFEVLVDCSVEHQEYIEDCEICCRPVSLVIDVAEDGTVTAITQGEDV